MEYSATLELNMLELSGRHYRSCIYIPCNIHLHHCHTDQILRHASAESNLVSISAVAPLGSWRAAHARLGAECDGGAVLGVAAGAWRRCMATGNRPAGHPSASPSLPVAQQRQLQQQLIQSLTHARSVASGGGGASAPVLERCRA